MKRAANISREILYTWEWQKLRVSLSFATLIDTRESIETLNAYLLNHHFDDPIGNRITRVNNMMNATKMGMNGQLKLHAGTNKAVELKQMILEVSRMQLVVSAMQLEHSMVLKEPILAVQRDDLTRAYYEEPTIFKKVLQDLTKRFYYGKGARISPNDNTAMNKRIRDRPELWRYIRLMEDVANSVERKKAAA